MRDWPTMPLGEAVDVRMGRQRSPKNASGDHVVPYLRAANVKDGALDLSDVKAMNFDLREQDIFALEPGDVLVTEGCGSLEQLGASARWDGDLTGVVCFQNTLLRLRAREGVTLPGYVYALARWLFWTGRWAAISSGTNIFHIGSRRAADMSVPVPPLEVQRRIVDLVDHTDAAIEAAVCVQAAGRVVDPSLAHAVFEVGETVSLELRQVVEEGGIQIGPFGSQLHASDYTEDPAGVPVVMPRDIVDGRIMTEKIKRTNEAHADRLSQHRLRPGDIVLPRRGDLTKRAVVTTEQAGWLCGTGCIRIRVAEGHDAALVFESLSRAETQRWINDNAVGATMKNLNSKIVGRIPLEIPRDEEGVARLFAASRKAALAGQGYVERLSDARRSLLSDLLGGEGEIPDTYDRFLSDVEVA